MPRVVGMMGPKCEREGIGQNVHGHHSDRHHTFCVTIYNIGVVVLAVPCRLPQNYWEYSEKSS